MRCRRRHFALRFRADRPFGRRPNASIGKQKVRCILPVKSGGWLRSRSMLWQLLFSFENQII